jgi:hypothetical protein
MKVPALTLIPGQSDSSFTYEGTDFNWDRRQSQLSFKSGETVVSLSSSWLPPVIPFLSSTRDAVGVWVDTHFLAFYDNTDKIEPEKLRHAVEFGLAAWLAQIGRAQAVRETQIRQSLDGL